MFPAPPSTAEGKGGDAISYLKPITDTADKTTDYGIMDSAWFLFHPNETKKFADVKTDSYAFINITDAIAVQGAKCSIMWINDLTSQIGTIHSEFMGVVGTRAIYTSRTPSAVLGIDGTNINSQTNLGVTTLVFPYDQSCTPVIGITTAKYPPEVRKWIHHLRYIHPTVDSKIEGLKLFEKVSETMGENVITYNSDTCSVDIDSWGIPTTTIKNVINPNCVKAYGSPHCIREIIRERMIETEPDEINKAWTELNGLMAKNLPIETKKTTALGTGLWTDGIRESRSPHGLIMVNDVHYWQDYIDPIKIPVAIALFGYLNDACQLVNHMYPVINKVRAEGRLLTYEPLLVKTVDNQWSQYKTAVPTAGNSQAPIDVPSVLDKWGYAQTQLFQYNWNVGVGLAVEETYPRKKMGSGTFVSDLLGNKTANSIAYEVDDDNLIPEEVVIPIA